MAEATLPDHLVRPHIRPFQTIPVPNKQTGQVLAGVRNPSGISQGVVAVDPRMLPLLNLFQGERTLPELSEGTKAPLDMLEGLAKALDQAGLIWGPTMDQLERDAMAPVRTRGALPVGAAAAFGGTAEEVRESLHSLLESAEDPELESPVLGIVAPHLDRERGGQNYAAAYRAVSQTSPAPERVVILGTNHFGLGDGVVMTRLAFDTPLGRLEPDTAILDALEAKLGNRLFKDEVDLLAEHSIQLHSVWVKHLFPSARVVAALIPDPMRPMIDDSDARASAADFAPALRDILASAPGRTLVISSADLTHAGLPFGDGQPVDEEREKQIEAHDRAMLSSYCSGTADQFLADMMAHRNATRWCSVGNMWTARVVTGATPELLQLRASIDENRTTLVSSAAIALLETT